MRIRVAGAALFTFAVLVYISGVLVESASLMAQGALGALGLGAGYVRYAGRGAPSGVRWALLGCLAAIAAIAAVVGAGAYWASQPTDFGSFTYAPADQARAELNAFIEEGVVRQSWLALGLLAATGCAAAAVWQLPERRDVARRRGRLPVAIVGGVAALALLYLAVDVWQAGMVRVGLGRGFLAGLPDLVAVIWLPGSAALVALATAVEAVRGARAGWPAAVGALFLGFTTVVAAGTLARSVPLPPARGDGVFLEQGLSYESNAVAVSVVMVDWTWAMLAVALIVAPVLIAAGCLRAAPGRSRSDPAASTDPGP